MNSFKEKTNPNVAMVKKKKKFLGCSLLEHFELGQKVGVGTFGEVLKAKHLSNGKVVALKKIFTKSEQEGFPMTSLREIKLLKNVSHPNVASLIDMAVSYKNVNENGNEFKEVEDIFMVFPFMDHDLTGLLENRNIVSLSLPQIKCYMKQMLEGIAYLHQKQIMHRDLKGANLLVNNKGELKITDFGLARPIEEGRQKYTPGVVTRWYRPPELLFGSEIYDESLDVWGAGCIIAEMYLRKPLFGAESDLEQLKMLCLYCGTPNEESYPGVSQLPDYSKVQLKMENRILKEFLISKKIDSAGVDLINSMLVMDPKKRPTAAQALNHEYFKCEPFPCLPGDIQKFESSHVYTVQQQKEKERDELEQKNNNNSNNINRQFDRRKQQSNRDFDHYQTHNVNFSRNSSEHENQKYPRHHHIPPPPPPPLQSTSTPTRSRNYENNRRNQYDSDYKRDTDSYRSRREYEDQDRPAFYSRSVSNTNSKSNSPFTNRSRSKSRSRSRSRSRSQEKRKIESKSGSSSSSRPESRRPISYDDLL